MPRLRLLIVHELYIDCIRGRQQSIVHLIENQTTKVDETRFSISVNYAIVVVDDPHISIQHSDPFNLFQSKTTDVG